VLEVNFDHKRRFGRSHLGRGLAGCTGRADDHIVAALPEREPETAPQDGPDQFNANTLPAPPEGRGEDEKVVERCWADEADIVQCGGVLSPDILDERAVDKEVSVSLASLAGTQYTRLVFEAVQLRPERDGPNDSSVDKVRKLG